MIKPNLTNIFYNLKNIFNYRIPNIVSSSRSIEYKIKIEKDEDEYESKKNRCCISMKFDKVFLK